MKKFSVISLAIVLMLSAMTMPAKAEVTLNDVVPLNITLYVPCANGGAGETIQVTGNLHVVLSTTTNDNRVTVRSHSQPQGASAVGLITGDTYRAVGVTINSANLVLTDGAAVTSFVNNFRMIGPGPGNNLMIHSTNHVTVNANGDVSSTHTSFDLSCS